MNERIKELFEQALEEFNAGPVFAAYIIPDPIKEKFAELIIGECTQLLFDESERLFGLFSEEINVRQADEYEMCSDQCIDNIALIEKHFGIV